MINISLKVNMLMKMLIHRKIYLNQNKCICKHHNKDNHILKLNIMIIMNINTFVDRIFLIHQFYNNNKINNNNIYPLFSIKINNQMLFINHLIIYMKKYHLLTHLNYCHKDKVHILIQVSILTNNKFMSLRNQISNNLYLQNKYRNIHKYNHKYKHNLKLNNNHLYILKYNNILFSIHKYYLNLLLLINKLTHHNLIYNKMNKYKTNHHNYNKPKKLLFQLNSKLLHLNSYILLHLLLLLQHNNHK